MFSTSLQVISQKYGLKVESCLFSRFEVLKSNLAYFNDEIITVCP